MDTARARGEAQLTDPPLLRVASIHALAYCERLFYLEEVEEIRVADGAVFDGRRAHVELDDGELSSFTVEAPILGLKGRLDALRRSDGGLVPVETKKGKSAPGEGPDAAWKTDRLQVGAYAMILEEALGQTVAEGRVQYLADHRSVRVPVDAALREDVRSAIRRANELRASVERPPVASNERLCPRCSVAPVCLPTEDILDDQREPRRVRILPPHHDRLSLHVLEQGAHGGRSGDELTIRPLDGPLQRQPIHAVGAVIIHGNAQISTQALRLCAEEDVAVHWISGSGFVTGALSTSSTGAQRHLRQFEALSSDHRRLDLARRLVAAKVEAQLRFLLRATRGKERSEPVEAAIRRVRAPLAPIHHAGEQEVLLGREGEAAAGYFGALGSLLRADLDPRLGFDGRNRHPSRDRFNALLNFGYGLLYRECLGGILAAGLHPGIGFYHRPRSAAHTLVLDLMELFRVVVVDMALVGALNRLSFDADADFEERGNAVWLSAAGRKKMIQLIERRKLDEWNHPAIGRPIGYGRMIELEARLLEKEWTDDVHLFARVRIR
ncbi:type I-MYXAN CRISPR-associated endonuclease Cas1 [Acidobacteria bacterium ACD]|nr:type I-MYXAN CRISPR-associated endonuclease Cas1 [Acidobacteria bacterium ACD]